MIFQHPRQVGKSYNAELTKAFHDMYKNFTPDKAYEIRFAIRIAEEMGDTEMAKNSAVHWSVIYEKPTIGTILQSIWAW